MARKRRTASATPEYERPKFFGPDEDDDHPMGGTTLQDGYARAYGEPPKGRFVNTTDIAIGESEQRISDGSRPEIEETPIRNMP